MHYHCEIILPPTDIDIETAIGQIMKPFCEEGAGNNLNHAFWDFWAIGGRWAGNKFLASLDPALLALFKAELEKLKITVSSLEFGKPEINPSEQALIVDSLWNRYFPESKGKPCPLFQHSNNIFDNESLCEGDILPLGFIPQNLKCDRIIIAYFEKNNNTLQAGFMLTTDFYNGCVWQNTDWDGSVDIAISRYKERIDKFAEEHQNSVKLTDEHLVVTVDYHG